MLVCSADSPDRPEQAIAPPRLAVQCAGEVFVHGHGLPASGGYEQPGPRPPRGQVVPGGLQPGAAAGLADQVGVIQGLLPACAREPATR